MRVKRGVAHVKRRKNLLSKTKGYRWRRKSSIRLATQASIRAGQHSYKHRRLKKRQYRAMWQTQISAAARQHELSYSKLMDKLHKAKIEIDRKVLAQLAAEQPEIFAAIVKKVS